MMKRNMIGLICLLILPTLIHAQYGNGRLQERVEAQRVAFMTTKMELTSDESSAFWPMYNEFQKAVREIRQELLLKDVRVGVSDDEASALIEQVLDNEQKQLDLKRSYFQKFMTVLPPQKVLMIGPLEKAFNREILKKLRK